MELAVLFFLTSGLFLGWSLGANDAANVFAEIENLDSVLNLCEGGLWAFSIETPDIPPEFHPDYRTLTEQVVNTVESLVLASRAFFRNIEAVPDHMHKVMFYEKEADKVSTKLKKAIFATDLPLSHKAHLRNFVEHIDNLADKSEDVADRLSMCSPRAPSSATSRRFPIICTRSCSTRRKPTRSAPS